MATQITWAKKSTFILASAGAAIGLGNLWKFPYMVGQNGGSAFVLIYIFCALLIGLPIMMSETIIGKFSKKNAVDAVAQSSFASGASKLWLSIPAVGFFALFLLTSFYCVVAGWSIDYTIEFASGSFVGKTPDEVGEMFGALLASPSKLIIYAAIFTILTAGISCLGAKNGIEKSIQFMMPLLFSIIVFVIIYASFTTGQFKNTVNYLFTPDFSKINSELIIKALGQAFFSLSIGISAIMTYAAYMHKDASITSSSIWIIILDTSLALLAGLAIFPFVFQNGLNPSEGPGLLFVSLSTAFANIPGGRAIGTAFFFLVFIAAISSSISMLEPFVRWTTDKFKLNRVVVIVTYCLVVFSFGLLTVYSFNELKSVSWLGGKSPFDWIDYVSSNILMPVGGLLTALYAGWALNKNIAKKELETLHPVLFSLWLFVTRFIAPAIIMLIFINAIFPELLENFLQKIT